MIKLEDYKEPIITFIYESIATFKKKHGNFTSMGIYCCPWSGWVSINFNINTTLEEAYNSCPDFEFVEFELIEFEDWQLEYESDHPTYDTGGEVVKHHHDRGDENVNKLFFNFLLPLLTVVQQNEIKPILLQMLDSEYCSQV